MSIGIIDADLLDAGTRHPNLALMKISKYFKLKGHEVKLVENYSDVEEFEHLYLSKVFTFTNVPEEILKRNNITLGGTGFLLSGINVSDLDVEIEHCIPDYELYDDFVNSKIANGDKAIRWKDYKEFSIGFITRGCFRKCDFCVNKKYDKVFKHADVSEFFDPDRKRIYLWDDNFLGYSNWEYELDVLANTGKYFQFRQGLDIRLLTDKKAKKLAEAKYYGDFIFAFDFIEDSDLINSKLKLWRKHSNKSTKLYLFCAYDGNGLQDIENIFKRIEILFQNSCLPYIMRYENYKYSEFKSMYIQIARWANQQNIVKKMSFREFCTREQELRKDQSKFTSSYRTMLEFEKNHTELANKYFDLKYENIRRG